LKLELLEFSLGFGLVEVVFTLSKEFLLWHIKELLISETEGTLHLSNLPAQLIIFIFNWREVINPIVPLLLSGGALHREGIRFLHQNLRSHPLKSASQSVRLRLLYVVQGQWVVNFVRTIRLGHYNVSLFYIGWVGKIGGVWRLASSFTLELFQVSIGK
jgi:hypothetical protein